MTTIQAELTPTGTGRIAAGVFAVVASAGFLILLPEVPVVVQIAVLAALELSLLVWVRGWGRDPQSRRAALLYGLRLQLQAASQTFLTLYLSALFAGTVLFLLMAINPDTHVRVMLTDLDMLAKWHRIGAVGCALLTLWLATVRLHALRLRAIDPREAYAGALNRTDLVLAAREPVVRARLEQRLDGLARPSVPGMAHLWYGAKPKIRRREQGAQTFYDATWEWCPSRLRMAVVPCEDGLTRIEVRCILRSCYYWLDLFPCPIDALAMLDYLRAHVLQTLGSEQALADSAAAQDRMRQHALEAQLRMLQAQIEPHFLFNTLANVRQLYRGSTDAGEQMMDHLISYLRCSMQQMRSESSSVAAEFDLAMHYLVIMQLRMGERLRYRFIMNDTVGALPFPAAMLMSLVENALMHGLRDQAEGELTISAAVDGPMLRVTVHDNGVGFSSVQGTGCGLSNIRQRLEAQYGSGAWLEVGAEHGAGFTACIVLPAIVD